MEYTWWAQRRGFFRNTLKDGDCDLVMGVPRGMPRVLTTRRPITIPATFLFLAAIEAWISATSTIRGCARLRSVCR